MTTAQPPLAWRRRLRSSLTFQRSARGTTRRLADRLVYLAVRSLVMVVQALPITTAYQLADALAWLAYQVDRRHRLVGLENLEKAFGDQYDAEQRAAMIRETYRHFCRMVVEIMLIPCKLRLESWRDYIAPRGHAAAIEELLDRDRPVIVLTGHYGNWEMAGYLFGVYGFASHAVARPLDNPDLDRFLRGFRERTGGKLIPKKGGYDQMVEVLQNRGCLAILADQDAGQNGLFVEFFGRPASTHKAIALLAIEHRASVVVGYARRVGPGFRYEVGIEEILKPEEFDDWADPVTELTQRYTRALERIIRRDPTQYLWLHRRWKHAPQPRVRKPRPKARAVAHRDDESASHTPPTPHAEVAPTSATSPPIRPEKPIALRPTRSETPQRVPHHDHAR